MASVAMTTRSKAAKQPSQKASSSKKTTSSKKTSTAKKTKAAAPVGSTPRGVAKPRHRVPEAPREDTRPASVVSSGTVSPSIIEETPPPTSRARLDEHEVASFLKEYLAGKSRSKPRHRSRSHRHRRHESSSGYSSSDSEQGHGPRVSFLHHQEGNKPFLKIHEQFRAVDIKYFKQIYYGTFKPKDLVKLAHGYSDWTWSKNGKDKKEETQEASGLNQLLRCFDVYCMAICHYAARPHVALKLHEALIEYRIRLSDFSVHYRFDSIRAYHYAFMSARILNGQDDSMAWSTEDMVCFNYLIRKMTNDSKPQAGGHTTKSSAPAATLSCNNFNAGKCPRSGEECKYAHICSNCQRNHSAMSCPKTHNSSSNANSIPLGNRVSRAD